MDERIETDDTGEQIDKIVLDYHRITRINPKVPISETCPYCIWDYTEQLIIDRASETIEQVQHIGTKCVVSRKYYVQDGISNLLDALVEDYTFALPSADDPAVAVDSDETREYEFAITFHEKPPITLRGTYDKAGLPDDFADFADDVWNFMHFYGLGEILDPAVYGKRRRKTDDYIFCSVEFELGGKSYYYLTEDETLAVHDIVEVPAGNSGNILKGEIVEIEYFREEDVPFPLDRTKYILRKYPGEENFACEDDEPMNLSDNIQLETPRLLLRPWMDADAADLYEFAKDPLVGPIAGWPVHQNVEDSRQIIRNVLSAPGTFAVVLKATGKAVGSVGLMVGGQSNLTIGEDEAEIGYWIGVPHWGQGLIPEAVGALMKMAFEDLGVSTLFCGYYDGNEKSRRVQEKCGFRPLRTMENEPCPLMHDVRTVHVARLTKEQWQAEKGVLK